MSRQVQTSEPSPFRKGPPGCGEWLASIPDYELSNILVDRQVEYSKKYVQPYISDPDYEDKRSDGGLSEVIATLQGTTRWTARVQLGLGERTTTAYLMFHFDDDFNTNNKSLAEQGFWFEILFPRFGPDDRLDGTGTGHRLHYLNKMQDDFVMSSGFYGRLVPAFYTHAAVTLPWSPKGGRLHLLDAKTKLWREPIEFSWASASEAEFAAFQEEVRAAQRDSI